MERRIVITGMGGITPIGNTVEEFWKGVKEGKCGVDQIQSFDTTNYKVKLAAEVKNYHPEDYFEKKEAKRYDRNVAFALVAAREAAKDAKIDLKSEENTMDANRVGVIVGSGIGGIITIEEQSKNLFGKGPDRVSPFFIPMSISNMAAGNVSIELGAKGESFAITTACASATHSMGEAYRLIKHGYQEVVFAGGCEASINGMAIAGFSNLKALTTVTDQNRASIPFDKERSGFVMGEGAGVLVLEELEHAKNRGATIYAEVIGYGTSSDAYHITSPAPEGEGGARAMQNAIKDAAIELEKIEYINAHGTSTSLNDSRETMAIKTVFGEHSKKVAVSSTKAMTGHLLGAAGAVEAIACIKALQEGFIPATIHLQEPGEDCDLDYVPKEGRKQKIQYAMSNSLGFGGHNSSIILKRYEEEK